jgi:hypothetical protein
VRIRRESKQQNSSEIEFEDVGSCFASVFPFKWDKNLDGSEALTCFHGVLIQDRDKASSFTPS